MVLIGAARAEEAPACPYCADWKPLSGHRFLSADVLVVRKDLVALPGCGAVKATFLQEQKHPTIDSATGLPPALLVYFRLEGLPRCSPSVSGAEPGALLELQYVPTHVVLQYQDHKRWREFTSYCVTTPRSAAYLAAV